MSETSDQIRTFILEELLFEQPDATLSDEAPLLEGVIDSLGLMQLVAFIESAFSIEVPDTAVTSENFSSVAAIDRLVTSLSVG